MYTPLLVQTQKLYKQATQLLYNGEYSTCLNKLEDFLKQEKSLPSPDYIAIQIFKGQVFLKESRYVKAWETFSHALDIARKNLLKTWELYARYKLGLVLFFQKNYQQLISLLEDLLEECQLISGKGGDFVLAKTMALLGESYCIENRTYYEDRGSTLQKKITFLAKAEKLILQAQKLFQTLNDASGVAEQKGNLARIYLNRNQFSLALRRYQESLADFKVIGDKSFIALQTGSVGAVYSNMGQFNAAINYLQQSVDLAREINDHQIIVNNEEFIAYIHQYCTKQSTKAIHHYLKAIETMEVIRNRMTGTPEHHEIYFHDMSEVYKELIELMCQQYLHNGKINNQKHISHIWSWMEKSKANVLLSRISGKIRLDTENTNDFSSNKTNRGELSDLDQMLANSRLFELSRTGYVEINQVQKHLTKDEVILSYYATLFHAYCVEISSDTAILYQLCTRQELDKHLSEYKAVMKKWILNGEKGNYEEVSAHIRKILSLKDHLIPDEHANYIISPELEIGRVAFEGLVNASNTSYLGLNCRFSYQPSISIFVNLLKRKEVTSQARFVGLAKSTFSSPFGVLEEAIEEVKDIEVLYTKQGIKTVELLLDRSANRVELEKKLAADCIHFASHAISGGDSSIVPEAAIILSKINSEDKSNQPSENDYLLASEIFAMKINAKLVVLSACEGAAGNVVYGEGIASLARAFLGAGAKCVICSLWAVYSDVAHDFMKIFYSFLIENNYNVSNALLESRKELYKTYSSASDWGAFLAFGDTSIFLNKKKESKESN